MSKAQDQPDSSDLPEPSPQFKGSDDELKDAAQALAEKFNAVWDDNDTTVVKIRRGVESYDNDLNVKLNTNIASSKAAERALEDTNFEFQDLLIHASGTVEVKADYVNPDEK